MILYTDTLSAQSAHVVGGMEGSSVRKKRWPDSSRLSWLKLDFHCPRHDLIFVTRKAHRDVHLAAVAGCDQNHARLLGKTHWLFNTGCKVAGDQMKSCRPFQLAQRRWHPHRA